MPFESDNIEIMTGFDTKEIIDELFDTLLDGIKWFRNNRLRVAILCLMVFKDCSKSAIR